MFLFYLSQRRFICFPVASLLYGNNNLFASSMRSEEPAARIVAEIFKLES